MTSTNKQALIDQANRLQKELDKLKEEINKPEEVYIEGQYNPKNPNVSYYIKDMEKVEQVINVHAVKRMALVGNSFRTFDEADKHLERIKIYNELKKLAGGHKVNILPGQAGFRKVYFYIALVGYKEGRLDFGAWSQTLNYKSDPFVVPFKTEAEAKAAIKTLGERKLRILFDIQE